ncbi:unnamed protein product [Prunus armeniaca]
MTLRGVAQHWFHTLPSKSISSFKELAYVFPKEYTSYRTIKKNPNHLYNLRKKSDESLQDYIKRFKAEKANTVGYDDRIASSAFKKATKQGDQPTKQTSQRSDRFSNSPQGDATAEDNYNKFSIPIHQILAQVKDKPWVRRPLPLKGDSDKRNTRKYRAFHGMHRHTMNNCFAWKAHLEELVRESYCMEFIAKQAIQQIEDRDIAKEQPQKIFLLSAEDDHLISFQKKDLIGLDIPHNDDLVFSIQIAQAMVDRIQPDEGSAANILQLEVILQMSLETKINKSNRSLTGFNGTTTVIVGKIDLDVYSLSVISSQ